MKEFVLSKIEIEGNITKLRDWIRENDYYAVVVRSTDEYLNEYVSLENSDRYHLSGFTGSTGDMIITIARAYLFLDGRYSVQGKEEASKLVEIVNLPLGLSGEIAIREKLVSLITASGTANLKVAIDAKKTSKASYSKLEWLLSENAALLENQPIPKLPFYVKQKPFDDSDKAKIRIIPSSLTGVSAQDKLTKLRHFLTENNIDFMLITALDEIAYLFNIRSYELPYSSSVKSWAVVAKRDFAYLFTTKKKIDKELKERLSGVFLEREDEYLPIMRRAMSSCKVPFSIACDENTVSYFRFNEIRELCKEFGGKCLFTRSFILDMKKIKNDAELLCMEDAFQKADIVMSSAIDYINSHVNKGELVSEKDLYEKIQSIFYSNKATSLSFSPIVASGANSAIVHYTNPDAKKIIKKGELLLLDIGGYWEGAYATDLTRTTLVGDVATKKQKKIYTVVLKSFVHLMSMHFKLGTTGGELDGIVREVLAGYGYICPHGIGHGVGIAVHEMPPSIGINSLHLIEENMVFSIEPGIYEEGFGGVRIENIVTIKKLKDRQELFYIKPLTYAPLDTRLIDRSYFDSTELLWLDNYMSK